MPNPNTVGYLGDVMYNAFYCFELLTRRDMDDVVCGLCGTIGTIWRCQCQKLLQCFWGKWMKLYLFSQGSKLATKSGRICDWIFGCAP